MIQPILDRVAVEMIEPESKSHGGVIIPDTAKGRPRRAKVVAVGLGRPNLTTGVLIPMDPALKKGAIVGFNEYSAITKFDMKGKEVALINQTDILYVE